MAVKDSQRNRIRQRLRQIGSSVGITIPDSLLYRLGVNVGDHVELSVRDARLILGAVEPHPRAGWAEDSKRLAEVGDDALVWPEFAKDDDGKLIW